MHSEGKTKSLSILIESFYIVDNLLFILNSLCLAVLPMVLSDLGPGDFAPGNLGPVKIKTTCKLLEFIFGLIKFILYN